uniref:Neogenin-like n=1 Tax=Globodera pallida TaxID=36090 RepID=A0A183CMA4_GLOPA
MPVDEGQYQCAVHVITQQQQHQHTGADQHGKESHWIFLSRRASLSLPSLHRFEQQPTDQHARIGQMAAFRCLLNSKPLAQIEWHHDNRLLKNGEGGYLVLPVSQTLEISHVRSEHAGVYKCVARNGDRSRTSQLGTLTVLDGEESPQSMHWVLEPRNQLVTVGDSVLLECLANNGGARQSTKIQWLHNSEPLASSAIDGGKPLNNNDDGAAAAAAAADVAPSSSSTSSVFAMVGRRRTHLLIRNVSAQTAGQYTCRAQNALRTQDVGATVAVRVSPTITIRPVDVLTQETNDVEFECVAEGVPTPRITWNKNGEVIIPSEYFVIASNKLRIFGLVRDDQGVYQCIADNEVGTEQAAAQLLVDQAASHLPLISPSSDDSVRALVVPKTPAQALSLRATDTGAQSVQLRWDAPLNNQKFGPITHYIVAYREEGSTSSDTQQTLDNLRPQTSYSVRVIAVNLVGPGTPSDALLITTKKQESLPGKVRSLRAEVLSSESIQVQWDEPTPIDASSNLDIRYKLFYVKVAENVTGHENEEDTEEDDDDDEDGDDASSETQVLMVKTSYTLHGVAKNAPYSIRVEAENVHGAGPSSEPFVVRTWPDTPSAPPRDVQADSLPQPGHAIRVRWRPPPRAQWNSDALIGHKLRYRMKGGRPPGGGKATASTVLVEEEEGEDDDDGMEGWWTHTLDGLEPGSPYLIRVAAVNQNGTGPWTDWTAVDTPEEQKEESQISGAPSELRVLASHDSVQVSWLPPRDDNVLIRGYLVGWGINIPDVEKATVEPEVRHFTIRGLKPNREYVISLRAFNRIGHGFPIYETVKTSSYGVHSSSVSSSSIADPKPTFGGFGHQNDNANSLPAPVGVVAEAISSSQMRLTWIDPNENAFNQLYTIKYGMSNTDEAQYKLLNSTETEHTFDGLRPDTLFEFAVRLAQSPHWSLNAVNRTFPAPPSSPPRDLTVIGPQSGRPHEDSDPSMVTLTWQPPKYANGEIQEYIVLYSDRPNLPDRDWVMDSVKGDRLSIAMRKLRPDRIYHFKLQARNVKGYGPFTPVASFTTATTFPPFGGADPNRSSVDDDSDSNTSAAILFGQFFDGMRSNLAFVLIGVVVVVVLLLVVALLAACFQRSKNDHNVRASATMSNRSQRRHKKQRNRSQQQSYIPGRKMSVSTPSAVAELDDDLWMIHQQPQQHNAGGGGGRFATLINASAIEDFESAATVDDGTGILLIDGQQRAFIAPSGAAGLNLQSAAMECLTPAHYQQAFHAATTQRQETEHGQLEGGVVEVAFGGGSVPPTSLPHGMLESFHSMTNPATPAEQSPKSGGSTGTKRRNQHRNSLPPHICPSSSAKISPIVAQKCQQLHHHHHHQQHDHLQNVAARGGEKTTVNFGRQSNSPAADTRPDHQRVATVRMHCGSGGRISKSSLNALDLSISPCLDCYHECYHHSASYSPAAHSSTPKIADHQQNNVAETESLNKTNNAVPRQFQVGISLPSMALQVKQAKRTATANYEPTTRRHMAPVKSVNFASKLVIVSASDDDECETETAPTTAQCRRRNGNINEDKIAFIDDIGISNVEDGIGDEHARAGHGRVDAGGEADYDDDEDEANCMIKRKKATATTPAQNHSGNNKQNDYGGRTVPSLSPAGFAMNSVGTLPRGHPNHHQHLHNSSASLEMKSAPQPLHLHQQQQNHYVQQQHQQQQQQQQLGNTPLTPRNPHVVYTRVNRQPIAKVDFSMNGAATAAATTTVPPHDSPHYQQRHQFVGGAVSSASAAGGTPPLPAPPSSSLTGACASRTATTTSSTTIISNHPQHNRNSSEGGYQTVGGGRGNCGTMRSFVDAGTTEDDGNGSCEALPVPSTGEQHHEQQQQQRMAHIVRPIVYAGGCGGGGGIAGGASPSPSTLRTHKFTYNNNGAKVPVGRATAQPRVNLATAAVAAAANLPSDVTALNALDLSISPCLDCYHECYHHSASYSPAAHSSTPKIADHQQNNVAETESLNKTNNAVPRQFQVGISLPSMALQVKQAKRTATANYEPTTRRHMAPVKSVNFASKLVIVSASDDDECETETAPTTAQCRRRNGNINEDKIAFIDDIGISNVEDGIGDEHARAGHGRVDAGGEADYDDDEDEANCMIKRKKATATTPAQNHSGNNKQNDYGGRTVPSLSPAGFATHKFTYNNNGAKVPVGRATAQPRVNLATAAVAAAANLPSDVTALYGYSAASPSQYANVRAAAAAANAVNTGGTKNSMEHGGGGGELYINNNNISSSKTIDSTEDLEEIDHM